MKKKRKVFFVVPLIISLTSCVIENPFYRDDKLIEEGIEDKSDSDKLNSADTELESQIEDNNDNIESSGDSKEDKGNETKEQENDEETDNPASEQSEDIGDGENQDDSSDSKEGNEEGDHQESHEHIHTLLTDEQAATCEKDGYIKTSCSDPNCDYYKEEIFPALGHNKVECAINNYIATRGSFFSPDKYYYSCSRCNNKFYNEYFDSGSSNFFFDKVFLEYAESEVGAEELRSAYKQLHDGFYKQLYSFNAPSDNTMIDVYFNFDIGKIKRNSITKKGIVDYYIRREFFDFFCEQNPLTSWWDIFYNKTCGSTYHYSQEDNAYYDTFASFRLHDEYLTGSSRKRKYDDVLNNLYSQVDSKVNKSMTDVEKAVILSKYCKEKFKYSADQSALFPALQTGKGNCQTYSRLFNLLARRYNLSSIYLVTSNHALNGVCIDNKLYYLDCTNIKTADLMYFCYPVDEDVRDNPFFPKKYLASSTMKHDLFCVYKDNVKVGVYYDLDSVLKDIVVNENSNYKIELGYKMSFSSSVYANTIWQATVEKCNCKSLTFTFGTDNGSLKINQALMKSTNVIIENENRCTII